jgi:hypothetical protein
MRLEAERSCDDGTDRYTCPDALIDYVLKFDEYGIIVHDGGGSMVQIMFCPWCGATLPDSKREMWFDELEGAGFDPLFDDIPVEYQSDAWYRDRRKDES